MNLVIDASIFVAASRDEEPDYLAAKTTLDQIALSSLRVCCPSLVLPECSSAIARITQSTDLARSIVSRIEQFPRLMLIPLDGALAKLAADVGARCRLRGADACYTALAYVYQIGLLTLDREMLQRGAAMVTTLSPSLWLQQAAESEKT